MSLIGVLLCSLAYHLWQENRRLKTEGIAATGTVIGHHSKSHYDRKKRRTSVTTAPIVRFANVQGQTLTATSDVYTSPPRFKTGERVQLWYAPENPEKILLAGAEEWVLTLILGGIGGLLSLAGIPNFYKALFQS